MKLQEASRRELKRISVGVAVCDGLLVAVLFLLSLEGLGTFSLPKILLSAICGSAIGILNFAILCLTVQEAVGIQNKNKMKRQFQRSYNLRLVLQAGWVVLCFVIPQIHFIAGAAPILFPNLVIFYQGTRKKPEEKKSVSKILEEDEEERLESFEV